MGLRRRWWPRRRSGLKLVMDNGRTFPIPGSYSVRELLGPHPWDS